MRYFLTPKGASEKTRLTYEYIQYSYNFYKDARQKLRNLYLELESNSIQVRFLNAGHFLQMKLF